MFWDDIIGLEELFHTLNRAPLLLLCDSTMYQSVRWLTEPPRAPAPTLPRVASPFSNLCTIALLLQGGVQTQMSSSFSPRDRPGKVRAVVCARLATPAWAIGMRDRSRRRNERE